MPIFSAHVFDRPDATITCQAEILRNNHDVYKRRACDANYGSQADRIRAMCEANNTADDYFKLTGEDIA